MFKKAALKLIKIYQLTISPDRGVMPLARQKGRFCRFYPSCSEYSYQAIKKYGLLKGSGMSFWRILRCNPFSKGGWDPVK